MRGNDLDSQQFVCIRGVIKLGLEMDEKDFQDSRTCREDQCSTETQPWHVLGSVPRAPDLCNAAHARAVGDPRKGVVL